MNVEYRTASIFEIAAEAYINPVNCVGIMGAGLAKQFKKAYPDNFEKYVDWCFAGNATPGSIFVVDTQSKYIVNLTTKDHWKNMSKPEWIQSGLIQTFMWMSQIEIKSIAIPMLGCGLGGLDWQKEIEPIYKAIFATFNSLDTKVTLLI